MGFNGGVRSLRGWVPVLGWCLATLASIGLATVALRPVLRTATPGLAVPPLESAAGTVGTPTPTIGPPAATLPPRTRRPTPPPTRSRAPSPTVPARPSGRPSATVVDGWTVTTGADGQPTYVRSFRLEGGQAVIRMTPGRVQLVTATPNPGYAVDTVQNEPGNLAVQFTEVNHYFIIHAVWHNGAPFAEVSEVGG